MRKITYGTGKQTRVQRKIEIEYAITRAQGRELRTPFGANGLSRFSVLRSTIIPTRDRT